MNSTPITIEIRCEDAVHRIMEEMEAAGFWVTRSFDLQSAREALIQPDECACPYHGTAECDCQYVILLVHSAEPQPYSVIVHGHDRFTHVSLVNSKSDPAFGKTQHRIQEMLERLSFELDSSVSQS